MFVHDTQIAPSPKMFTCIKTAFRGNWYKKLLIILSLLMASLYPVYKNIYYAKGIEQYSRQRDFMNNNSMFYNPWQYRLLCPMIIEGAKWTYDHTIDKVIPLEKVIHFPEKPAPDSQVFQSQLQSKDKLIYLGIFILFRAVLNACIYGLSFILLSIFIKSNWLKAFALLFISFSLGSAVHNSDLSFNTYLDVVLYLLAACVMLYRKNPWWIPVITLAGVLNRETALLIPALYLVEKMEWRGLSKIKLPAPSVMLITGVSLIVYVICFVGIRLYYGYRAPEPVFDNQVMVGLPMLRVNLFSGQAVKSYFEMYGALGVLPFTPLFTFRHNSRVLQNWFIILVPAWVSIHLLTSIAAESRCYLVPFLVVLLPMLLQKIQHDVKGQPV